MPASRAAQNRCPFIVPSTLSMPHSFLLTAFGTSTRIGEPFFAFSEGRTSRALNRITSGPPPFLFSCVALFILKNLFSNFLSKR